MRSGERTRHRTDRPKEALKHRLPSTMSDTLQQNGGSRARCRPPAGPVAPSPPRRRRVRTTHGHLRGEGSSRPHPAPSAAPVLRARATRTPPAAPACRRPAARVDPLGAGWTQRGADGADATRRRSAAAAAAVRPSSSPLEAASVIVAVVAIVAAASADSFAASSRTASFEFPRRPRSPP